MFLLLFAHVYVPVCVCMHILTGEVRSNGVGYLVWLGSILKSVYQNTLC